MRKETINREIAKYAIKEDGYSLSHIPIHLQTEELVCMAAKNTGNAALASTGVRHDLKTEMAYHQGMDKDLAHTFLMIPLEARMGEHCLLAEKWYPALLEKRPEVVPEKIRNGCNVYSLNRKMEQSTGSKYSAGQIIALYNDQLLSVKEIETLKGKLKNVAVLFNKEQMKFTFSPLKQKMKKGRKL